MFQCSSREYHMTVGTYNPPFFTNMVWSYILLLTCHTCHLNIFPSYLLHESGLYLPVGHLSYFWPNRQEYPIKFGRTVALVKGLFAATTILPQTQYPKQAVLLRAKIIIIGPWLFCVGRRRQDYQMQTLLTPAASTSIISSISTTFITNFVCCSLPESSWRIWNHWGSRIILTKTCSMVVEFFLWVLPGTTGMGWIARGIGPLTGDDYVTEKIIYKINF